MFQLLYINIMLFTISIWFFFMPNSTHTNICVCYFAHNMWVLLYFSLLDCIKTIYMAVNDSICYATAPYLRGKWEMSFYFYSMPINM